MDKEPKGFLLIRQTYKVRCQQCGWKGEAKLGAEPILTEEQDGAEFCPICGHLALVGDEKE